MTDTPWWHEPGSEQERGADPLGTAAEEAGRLFAAMRERMLSDPAALRAGLKLMETVTMFGRSGRPVGPGEAPECAYCPFCQAISRARSLSPETVERLTGAALEFADVVRQVVVQPGGDDTDVVRHVPLDDDDEDPATWGGSAPGGDDDLTTWSAAGAENDREAATWAGLDEDDRDE